MKKSKIKGLLWIISMLIIALLIPVKSQAEGKSGYEFASIYNDFNDWRGVFGIYHAMMSQKGTNWLKSWSHYYNRRWNRRTMERRI